MEHIRICREKALSLFDRVGIRVLHIRGPLLTQWLRQKRVLKTWRSRFNEPDPPSQQGFGWQAIQNIQTKDPREASAKIRSWCARQELETDMPLKSLTRKSSSWASWLSGEALIVLRQVRCVGGERVFGDWKELGGSSRLQSYSLSQVKSHAWKKQW